MSGTCPEECLATSGRILDEEGRVGPAAQATLRLLIKTRQCFRLLDSNRMFSARCQQRLLSENSGTNYGDLQKSQPTSISVSNMTLFHVFVCSFFCCCFFLFSHCPRSASQGAHGLNEIKITMTITADVFNI